MSQPSSVPDPAVPPVPGLEPRPAPLAGVRILDVEQYGAGSFGTMYLADLGADIIKIEGPATGGDASRYIPPGQCISFSRSDASLLAQAKAANACGQRILLRRLGVSAEQVDRVYLAGGFANAINVPNAIAIGLLAPVPIERVERVGNAALRGAAALLLSTSRRDALDALVRRIEHVELETELDFFELFVDGCRFVPLAA